MRNRRSTEITALLTTSAALVVIFFASCESSPPLDRKLHDSIGKALAKETLSLLGTRAQITIITRDTETFAQPAFDVLLDSFKREVGRAGGNVGATKLIQTDPLRPVDVPPGDFFELIQRASAGHVIVSLLGPPLLTEEQLNKLGPVKPKIVAFCSGNLAENIDLRPLFDAGLLHAAVVSRRLHAATGKSIKNQNSFDQLYGMVKPADFSMLAPGLGIRQKQPDQ
jgi:hypothetical protein